MNDSEKLIGEAAGVPFVAVPPETGTVAVPMVVVWHLLDPPRSEIAMQAALPLVGVSAWRIYLGLPMSGPRLPEGGLEAFFQMGYQDAVLMQFNPIARGGVAEFPAALAELQERYGIAPGPLHLVGGSAVALVALSVVTETDLPVGAVALISPAIQLAAIVAANERRFDVTYPWTEPSLERSAQKFCGLRDCGRGAGVLVIGLSSTESWIVPRSEPRQEGVTTCE